MSVKYVQDSLISTVKETTHEEEKKDNYEGASLSPTSIVKIIPLYESYGHLPPVIQKEKIFEYKQKGKEITKDRILLNAKSSIYGTLIHNLEYFAEIFSERPEITLEYLETTFPRQENKKKEDNNDDIFYYSLLKIQELANKEYGLSEDSFENALNFWNMWRLNGQDYKPKGKDGAILNALDIKNIWENDIIPLEHINIFRKNFQNNYKNNSSQNIYERMFGRNINFENSNLKTTSFIDKISIPTDYPDKPIKIIDFKTGKQFKYPNKAEKLQIFLMSICAYCNLIDHIDKKLSTKKVWDMVHDSPNSKYLKILNKDLLSNKKKMYTSISHYEIINFYENIAEKIQFSYINPLTQQEIVIDLKNDLGLNSYKDIISLLKYIEQLNEFYISNKEVLKSIINNKNPAFLLPKFPIKDFYKDDYVENNIAVQQSFL